MFKLITIGEALIDFIPLKEGYSLKNTEEFKKACGGAPTNVSSVAAKLGEKAIVLTKLGEDSFGDYIVDELNNIGVDTSYIKRSSELETSLAFAALDKDGDRSFAFYRKNAADLDYDVLDLPKEIIDNETILHFCSVDLIPSKMKEAHKEIIKIVKNSKGIVSFDPNLRLMLWEDKKLLKTTVNEFLDYADIVKVSDDELDFIFGTNNLDSIKEDLFKKGVKWFICSKGKDGVVLMKPDFSISVPGYKVKVVDTTGAGDSLIGALLTMLLKNRIKYSDLLTLDYKKCLEILTFANIYAAHTTTIKGAIPALGTIEEIEDFSKKL